MTPLQPSPRSRPRGSLTVATKLATFAARAAIPVETKSAPKSRTEAVPACAEAASDVVAEAIPAGAEAGSLRSWPRTVPAGADTAPKDAAEGVPEPQAEVRSGDRLRACGRETEAALEPLAAAAPRGLVEAALEEAAAAPEETKAASEPAPADPPPVDAEVGPELKAKVAPKPLAEVKRSQ